MVKMFKFYGWLLVLTILFAEAALAASAAQPEKDCIYYFYGDSRDCCTETNAFLKQMQEKYPQIQINYFEVYYNQNNEELLQSYFKAYKVPVASRGLPAVFLPGSYFIGEESIKDLLEGRIVDNTFDSCPSIDLPATLGVVGEEKAPKNLLEGVITFWSVTSAALSNSFNLGMIALLLILLAIISATRSSRELIQKGLPFLIGVFLANLFFGMGLFSWFGYSKVSYYFYKAVAVLAILFGLLFILNFLAKGLLWSIDDEQKKKWKKAWQYFLPEFILVLGFVTGLFSWTKFSDAFIQLRHLFVIGSYRSVVLPLLGYYALILVLPLIILLWLFFYLKMKQEEHTTTPGRSIHHREQWEKHHYRLFNLGIGTIMIILGMVLLF